jgi:hypothetical protein
VTTGKLAEEYFRLPEEEHRRLWTNCTQAVIDASCREFQLQQTDQLRQRYEASGADSPLLFIDNGDLSEVKLLCPRCHDRSLCLRQVVVWADCRTDCGHRYQWIDSEELGCPRCEHRPHAFEINEELSGGAASCVCWCGCSSHTVCRTHEDAFCPKCGQLPQAYEREGIAYCGLHHHPMIPYRLPSSFLFQEPVARGHQASFPRARIFGVANDGEGIESRYCEVCDGLYRDWLKARGLA